MQHHTFTYFKKAYNRGRLQLRTLKNKNTKMQLCAVVTGDYFAMSRSLRRELLRENPFFALLCFNQITYMYFVFALFFLFYCYVLAPVLSALCSGNLFDASE